MVVKYARGQETSEALLKEAYLAAFKKREAVRETIPLEQRIGIEIRRMRAERRLTLQDVAKGSGLSSAMLSRLENGQTAVSLDGLERLCAALGVSLSALFRQVEDPHGFAQHLKVDDQVEVIRIGTKHGHSYRLLAYPDITGQAFEPFVIDIHKDSETYKRFQHEGIEFIYMIFGRMRYRFGEETFLLEPGDALTFTANVVHGPEELLDDDIRFLAIIVDDGQARAG